MNDTSATERKQDRAIIALLAEPTLEAAAAHAEVGSATLWRWMQQPEFKSRLRAARRAVVEGAIGRLQAAATAAVETLQRNLTCGTPSVEVKAAATILDQAIKAIELFDVIDRVEHLEARLGDGSREAQP